MLREWGKEFVFEHCIHLFSYKLTEIHGKLCIIKWTCIENISNFTAPPETECDKTGTLRLDCSNSFYDLVPHLWSPPHAVSDLFCFQRFEAPLVFDLSLAILHVGFSTPSRCPHKPLSMLRKGKNLLFQRLWWLPLIRQPVSIWRVPSGLRLPATQHGPSTAVHIYREDTPLSFQQNDISTSHYYPWTKNVVLGLVVELTLLGTDCLHFPTLRLRCHCLCNAGFSTLQQWYFLEHSGHRLHVWCSISRTLEHLSPSIPPHSFAALIILSDRAAADEPRLPLYDSMKSKSSKRRLHYFLSSVISYVPLQTSQTTGEASSVCFQLNKKTTNKISAQNT